ncbi:hypothetical protein COY87_01890 [Candidatus Roizmanbacteria bacterium CG_4_10_14_0_8_um_filter_33_9]|uniref:Uncharacterized protein n=1 Tax=Candidatus Roizmanbacteria bacterium CG_4_10_14_0_8_um_filter_33_9 TaxID=1974826 RepID=A0A2M7QJT2_9BACT|nr:MAG: hypothetical protein COY87_01890 [Candidatus Roizmanbacteria bacterium CG_4_10_14_0_8_um_filter_33_9]
MSEERSPVAQQYTITSESLAPPLITGNSTLQYIKSWLRARTEGSLWIGLGNVYIDAKILYSNKIHDPNAQVILTGYPPEFSPLAQTASIVISHCARSSGEPLHGNVTVSALKEDVLRTPPLANILTVMGLEIKTPDRLTHTYQTINNKIEVPPPPTAFMTSLFAADMIKALGIEEVQLFFDPDLQHIMWVALNELMQSNFAVGNCADPTPNNYHQILKQAGGLGLFSSRLNDKQILFLLFERMKDGNTAKSRADLLRELASKPDPQLVQLSELPLYSVALRAFAQYQSFSTGIVARYYDFKERLKVLSPDAQLEFIPPDATQLFQIGEHMPSYVIQDTNGDTRVSIVFSASSGVCDRHDAPLG